MYDVLDADPAIRLGRSKEIRFFNQGSGRNPNWYADQFRLGSFDAPLVDVCHDYFSCRGAEIAAKSVSSDVRVVVVLRNPVLRSWSDYAHRWQQGRLSGPLLESIDRNPGIIRDSLYSGDARRWLEALGPERCTFMPYELIAEDPGMFVADLYEALSLKVPPTLPAVVFSRSNAARTSRNPTLLRAARAVGGRLQDHGLHEWTHRVKRHSLTARIFYSSRSSHLVLGDSDRAWLKHQFAEDVRALSEVIGEMPARYWPELVQ
ncbi:MAG: sulfotransferase domain-containing protein [Solirubrobacterales bacterium]